MLAISNTLFAAEVTKEYHKEFTSKPTTTLDINSKYGNVVIESWNENRIVIDVKVTVKVPNKEREEKDISNIDVLFSENGNVIKAWTEINSRYFARVNGRITNTFGNISINYNVKMPLATALNLENKYGNITIVNELSGLVNLNVRYGNLTAGKLTRGDEKPWNTISLGYGRGNIEEAGWLTLNTSYVGMFEISKCTAVVLESKYSKLNLGLISSIVGESRYDNIRINNIINLELDNRFSNINIGTMANSLKLKTNYGPLTVDNITAGFESIEIESRYANIKLGIADNASYELNGKARYGGIKYNENNFNIRQRIQENNSLTIVGTMGKDASPKAKVKIDVAYATVNLGQ